MSSHAAPRPSGGADVGGDAPSKIIASKVSSYDGPTAVEKQLNIPLETWKETQIEPKEESDRRFRALKRLDALMRAWIRHVMINDHRMSEKDAARYEGRIYTTGSYRYNVHTTGSDIDAVLIAPKLVTQEHFFDSFAARLRAEPLISEVTPVRSAKVPIIAIKFDGIEMDLSFGSIQQEKVPEKITDALLRGLDEASVRSASAPRVAQQLLEYAPLAYEFRTALRFIKLWAKVRGIHGSQYGFPTGIGWAILVCHVCQCNPKKNAAGILASFFRMYKFWYEPDRTNTSIYLSETRITSNEFGRSWDPTHRWDSQALFPVLTPVAPSTNACDMVNRHTLRILCREFARGHQLVSAAVQQQQQQQLLSSSGASSASPSSSTTAPAANPTPEYPFGVWSKVLEPYSFFEDHPKLLHIKVSTVSAYAYVEGYKPYVDSIESRLYRLLSGGKGLDQFPNICFRPWPKRFEDPQQVAYIEAVLKRQRATSNNSNAPAAVDGSAPGHSSSGDADAAPLVPPSSFLTAHIFIGIDVLDPKQKTAAGSGAAAPAGAANAAATPAAASPPAIESDPLVAHEIRTFEEFFVTEASFRHGITMRPEVRVISSADVPSWIYDPSKSKVLKQRAEEAAAAAAAAEEAEAKRLANPPTPAVGSDEFEHNQTVGEKRQRETTDDGGNEWATSRMGAVPTSAGFEGFSRIPSIMSSAVPVGVAAAGYGSRPTYSAAPVQQQQPIIAIARSVVSKVPIIAAPTLDAKALADVEDELGMDF